MISPWVFFSITAAFTLALSDALTKRALAHTDEYLAAFFRLLFSLPFLICLLLLVPVPRLDREFCTAFALSLPLEIIAMILYIKSLQASPLSLTLPFLSLTPVFLILISYIILGETVSMRGGAGILLVAAGSYVLHLHDVKRGWLEPLRAIIREKGSVMMIGVAVIYSVTSSLGKMAVEHSSPLFFGGTYFAAMTILMAPVALYMGRSGLRRFSAERQYRALIAPGILYSVMIASHMTAISMTKVAYMISLKRTSILIGVILGYFLFREKNIRERLAGAAMMFVGFVLIVTAT